MTCGIYSITSPSGKKYIGSSLDCERRWTGHRRKLLDGKHHCDALQRAANKYGFESLVFQILESCEADQLIRREQRAIDSIPVRNLYNTRLIADTCGPMSNAVKAKLRAAWKTRPPATKESRERQAASASATRNTSGYRGVSLIQGKYWRAFVGKKHVGQYRTAEEANAARLAYIANPEAHKLTRKRHPSGHKGVIWNANRARWAAYDGSHKYIGLYETVELAAEARARFLADPASFTKPSEIPRTPGPSGHTGVTWDKNNEKWIAFAPKTGGGSAKHLGRYKTIEEAVAARAAYLESVTLPKSTPSAPE